MIHMQKFVFLILKKNVNVKVFNLMSLTNETKHIEWHKSCKCICRLNKIICNSKQRWNEDKCRCECKELIDKGVCEKGFIWSPSNCECDKSCDIGEYLNYSNCKCRKKLVDPLIKECTENIDETKLVNVTLAEDENSYHKCNRCKMCIHDSSFYNIYWSYYLFCLLQLVFD